MSNQETIPARYVIVVLAAGNASRLGSAKQMLEYKGKKLIQRAVETALESAIGEVLVILGARSGILAPLIEQYPVTIIGNAGWEEGMASSIRMGMKWIEQNKLNNEGVIFMVVDQPFVTAELLRALVARKQETGLAIVASAYNDVEGTPALFDRSVFEALSQLKGDTGAKKVLQAMPENVTTVPFPEGIFDIDTWDDYEQLLQNPKN